MSEHSKKQPSMPSPLIDLVIEIDTNNQIKQLKQTQMQCGPTKTGENCSRGGIISDQEDADSSSYYYCNDESTNTISTHLSSAKSSAVIEIPQKSELSPQLSLGNERLDALESYWKEKEYLAQEQRRNGILMPLGYCLRDHGKNFNNGLHSNKLENDDSLDVSMCIEERRTCDTNFHVEMKMAFSNLDCKNTLMETDCKQGEANDSKTLGNDEWKEEFFNHTQTKPFQTKDNTLPMAPSPDTNEFDTTHVNESNFCDFEQTVRIGEEGEEDIDSQLPNTGESSYSSGCSSCGESDDSSTSESFLPKTKTVGNIDQKLIIVDFRRNCDEQTENDLNSCTTFSNFPGNENVVSKTKQKEELLFDRILALSTNSTSSKNFPEKLKSAGSRSTSDVDIESGRRTISCEDENNGDKRETSTQSVASSASASLTNISGSHCPSFISLSSTKYEGVTTHRQSNSTGKYRLEGEVSIVSGPTLWNRIQVFFHDLLQFLRSRIQQLRCKMKEDDFRKSVHVWCFSVLIGLILIAIFLIASRFLSKNRTLLEPRDVLIQNKLSFLSSSPSSFQNSSTPQYKALQWILHGEHSNPLNYDSPNLIQRYCLAVLYYASNGDRWSRCGQTQEWERNAAPTISSNNSLCIDEQGNLSFKFLSSQNECSWFGVRCIKGNVASIILEENNLVGSLPSELFELKDLYYLVLSKNLLEGALPNNLRKLQKLRTLLLNENQFSIISSDSISQLPLLKILSLGYNSFHGTVPREIFRSDECPISMLDLSHNIFTGTIPQEIFRCTHMEKINIEGNQLTGTIPYEFGNLPNLKLLMLGNNLLSGLLNPLMFTPQQHLQYFDIHQNNLSGSLPETLFSNAVTLTTLSLGYNKFSGALPDSFGSLKIMKNLFLWSNHFTGTIPSTIGTEMSQLEFFYAANNDLIGSMPDSICTLRKTTLQHLSADCSTVQRAPKNSTAVSLDGKVSCFCCTACAVDAPS